MRILIQRIRHGRVEVDGQTLGRIPADGDPPATGQSGLLLLIGIGRDDREDLLEPMARKVVNLRIFSDHEGKMNRSLIDIKGEILAVSQFTLYANCRKGRRPSFLEAAAPERGSALFDAFIERLRGLGAPVQTGQFGAMMDVHLLNDGPVTIWLDSAEILG